jgi:hypothetical protein
MLTVAMVLRTGGDYDREYVRRLCEGVREHLQLTHQIVCLSDDPGVQEYCAWLPLKTDWTGWWAKLELFQRFKGPTLYLDLDTLVVGDITPLGEKALEENHFTMLSDLFFPQRPASGVMAWNGDFSHLAEGFDMSHDRQHRKTELWGDQGWIMQRLGFDPDRWQDRVPGMIVSWKVASDEQRHQASLICYHGKPRPHTTGWAVYQAPQYRTRRRAG